MARYALCWEKNLKSERTLSCVFFKYVSCSSRTSAKSGMKQRCFGCGHYKRFVNEMEREEEEFWKEVNELRGGGSAER